MRRSKRTGLKSRRPALALRGVWERRAPAREPRGAATVARLLWGLQPACRASPASPAPRRHLCKLHRPPRSGFFFFFSTRLTLATPPAGEEQLLQRKDPRAEGRRSAEGAGKDLSVQGRRGAREPSPARAQLLLFIDSRGESAAEAPAAAPASPKQGALIYLYGLLRRSSGR